MPFIGYSDSGVVVEVRHGGSGALEVVDKAVIPGGVVCAASAGDDVVYYVPRASPASLHRWMFSKNEGEFVQDLVWPQAMMFFHHNKIFCVPLNGNGVAAYDPLCGVVEVLPIPYSIKWVAAADQGFVFRTKCGKSLAYDFSSGVTEVRGGEHITSFLGHYKRYAVVTVRDGGAERVAGVTEDGDVVALSADVPPLAFVELDDTVLYVDEEAVVSTAGARVAAPVGGLRLVASPATEEDVACSICLCEFDGEDGVTLDCGHLFHKECIDQWVSTWMDFAGKGEHVTFTHAVCASGCKYLIRHPLIPQSRRIAELCREVTAKKTALLPQFDAAKTDEDLLFYLCGQCGSAFYGGERVCSRMQGREPSSSPHDLVCDTCLAAAHTTCGAFVPVFKCRYCCNPATHRSFGTRYMCERCNARWDTSEPAPLACPGGSECPFDGHHDDEKGGFVGCLLCSCDVNCDHVFDRVVDQEGASASPAA